MTGSDINVIAEHLFGSEFIQDIVSCNNGDVDWNSFNIVEYAQHWVKKILDRLGLPPPPHPGTLKIDKRPGRLGQPQVIFDSATQVGMFIMSADRLRANSQSNFSTLRANTCFYQGKWQYELQLETKGVMQVGWAMANCKFSSEIGVGDTIKSYAYDGNRMRKWNVSTNTYGESWLSGDIIGSTVDLDKGTICFYRNGRSLGEAFTDIQMGPGHAYFPAVSLAFNEILVANFGGTPFKYPVEGFLPPQQAPTGFVTRASQIFQWFGKLLETSEMFNSPKRVVLNTNYKKISSSASFLVFARLLMHELVPLLHNPYIIESNLVPFLYSLVDVSQFMDEEEFPDVTPNSKFNLFFDMLAFFVEPHEIKYLVDGIVKCLLSTFKQVSESVSHTKQREALIILSTVLFHQAARTHLLTQIPFTLTKLPELMDVKPLDKEGMQAAVPTAWWDLPEEEDKPAKFKFGGKTKSSYMNSCKKLKNGVRALEVIQEQFLQILLDNTDSDSKRPSSRKLFLQMFRNFLKDNRLSNRILPAPDQTPLPVTLCYFYRLLSVIRYLWMTEIDDAPLLIPISKFYDGSIDYFNIDRLGGVLSHLVKTHHGELAEELGPEHPIFSLNTTSNLQVAARSGEVTVVNDGGTLRFEGPNSADLADQPAGLMLPMLARMLNQQGLASRSDPFILVQTMRDRIAARENVKFPTVGPAEHFASLIELLDGIILLYHSAAHKQLFKVSMLREKMNKYISALNDTRERLEEAKVNHPDAVPELQTSIEAFELKLQEHARIIAWIRAAVYTPEYQENLVWLLRIVLQTLQMASRRENLFSFVPDFYLDVLVELSVCLRTYFHPTVPLEEIPDHEALFIEVGDFLARYFSDPRIVHAASQDTLIQALASFVASPRTLRCIEKIPEQSRLQMVRALLKPYEHRPWAQSNWILMRIWQGDGFAFRYQKSPHLAGNLGPRITHPDSLMLMNYTFPPTPSSVFQEHIAAVLMSEEEMASSFLNSILNQLNWAFSEFIGMLQEIQSLSNRPERVYIESRQLKVCATCFDLALGLLRVLEMIATVCNPVFTDFSRHNSETLLGRICQLLCQILIRVSSTTGCFYHVINMDIPDLESIDPFPILTAVVGILIALLRDDLLEEGSTVMSPAAKALLAEPGFQLSSLKFILGEEGRSQDLEKKKTFSLLMYPNDVSPKEISNLKLLIKKLSLYQNYMSTEKDTLEDDLCLICCARPMSVLFVPCHHKSCKACITHHLMNCQECFFCKTTIECVKLFDGSTVFDCTKLKATEPVSEM